MLVTPKWQRRHRDSWGQGRLGHKGQWFIFTSGSLLQPTEKVWNKNWFDKHRAGGKLCRGGSEDPREHWEEPPCSWRRQRKASLHQPVSAPSWFSTRVCNFSGVWSQEMWWHTLFCNWVDFPKCFPLLGAQRMVKVEDSVALASLQFPTCDGYS